MRKHENCSVWSQGQDPRGLLGPQHSTVMRRGQLARRTISPSVTPGCSYFSDLLRLPYYHAACFLYWAFWVDWGLGGLQLSCGNKRWRAPPYKSVRGGRMCALKRNEVSQTYIGWYHLVQIVRHTKYSRSKNIKMPWQHIYQSCDHDCLGSVEGNSPREAKGMSISSIIDTSFIEIRLTYH